METHITRTHRFVGFSVLVFGGLILLLWGQYKQEYPSGHKVRAASPVPVAVPEVPAVSPTREVVVEGKPSAPAVAGAVTAEKRKAVHKTAVSVRTTAYYGCPWGCSADLTRWIDRYMAASKDSVSRCLGSRGTVSPTIHFTGRNLVEIRWEKTGHEPCLRQAYTAALRRAGAVPEEYT